MKTKMLTQAQHLTSTINENFKEEINESTTRCEESYADDTTACILIIPATAQPNNNIFRQQSYYSNEDCHQILIIDGSPIGEVTSPHGQFLLRELLQQTFEGLEPIKNFQNNIKTRPKQLAT